MKTTKTKKANKYLYLIIVQEYVNGYGWEDSCTEETTQDARKQVKCYRENGIPARIIRRRELNPAF